MPSANAKPTGEALYTPLAAFSFSFVHIRGRLAGAPEHDLKQINFHGRVRFTSLSMKKLCLVFGICWAVSSGCFGKEAYRFLSEIPIGGEGGWDILTIDPAANRLYLSHSTKVVVVDLSKNAVAGEVTDMPGVHAFVAYRKCNAGFHRMAKNRNQVSSI